MVERKPIITEPKQIVMVHTQPTIHDLIPDYQYQFQNDTPDEESSQMYADLLDFLSTNEEIAVMDISNKAEYGKGFKKAIAMVKLWIDSLYLHTGGVQNGFKQTYFHRENTNSTAYQQS